MKEKAQNYNYLIEAEFFSHENRSFFSIENECICKRNDCNSLEEMNLQLHTQLYLSQPFYSIPRSLMNLESHFM